MKQIKPLLGKLYRSAQFFNKMDRTEYIRLDGNESVDGLPEEFIRYTLNSITPAQLAAYPNPCKCTESVAKYLGVDREEVLLTNGSDAAIKMLFEVYVNEGDRVIIASPCFEMYEVYCQMYGAEVVELTYGDDFEFPYEEYSREVEKGAKFAIITNPNNPTGTVLSEELLLNLIMVSEKKDVLVMLDEAYYWIYNKTLVDKIKQFNNLIVLRTFSKILGIAGLRLGMAVANKNIIMDLKKVAPPAGVNTIALLFGEKIMDNPLLIEKLVSDFKQEKAYLISKLVENNIEFINTDSNYVLIEVPTHDLQKMLADFREAGILVALKMGKYLRVNVGMKKYSDAFIEAYRKIIL